MRETFVDATVEVLGLLAEVGAMVLLTGIGLGAEYAGLQRFGVGLDGLTVWYLFVGTLALYAGVYMIGVRRIAPRILSRVESLEGQ